MKNDVGKVIGIVRGYSKEDKPFCKIYLVGDMEDYISDNNDVIGNECTDVYVPGSHFDWLELGKIVEIVYGKGFQGKAVVKGLKEIE